MSTDDATLPAAPRIDGSPPHLLVVRAPYYREVADGLTRGAERILRDAGATFEILDVAGAYELPQAIRLALRGPVKFDGFVALGCVVKGETDHYDHICRETIGGLMQLSLQFGLALGQGVLTAHRLDQALARSGQDGHNKGAEAAAAALVQIGVARRFAA
ncbi:MAG: 6,7-dimethyl-8-ribityllumazine synthase [Rhodospirillales bacterium]|jgi:6,7-dimethyl-8-ribityllumazine synthase|nr:6,7-dimethyl-8-ribityllumazine synthase [Rhodospirillales bacterium]